MSLAILALLFSLQTAEPSGLVNVAANSFVSGLKWSSMKTLIRTKSYIHHLEEDAFLPGNILYADGDTLMTTDAKTTDLITGSGTGYAEGSPDQAQFREITGFLQYNSSHVLLVDFQNNCLRRISRMTKLTSPFFGRCSSNGFVDGVFTRALFYRPRSIITNYRNPEKAIVTDHGNRALRLIDLLTGNVKTLISSLPAEPIGTAYASDVDSVFITFFHFLGKFNLKTSTFTPLMPTANRGGLDGDFRVASFGSARGIFCLSKVCLVADWASNKLRILHEDKQTAFSICTGNLLSADGTTANCSLMEPHSLMLIADTLFIGERGAIRTISVMNLLQCEDVTFVLAGGEREKCLVLMPGRYICFPLGSYFYTIPERKCTIRINITKELDACQMDPCQNSGICIDRGNYTYICTCQDGWTGRNCQTEIDACTVNHCRNSGRCVPINRTFKCLCMTGWDGSLCERDIRNITCPDEILGHGDLKTMKAEIKLSDGDIISLPIGKYNYQKKLPNNRTCEITVHISDPRLKVRLDVSASYKLACSLLSDFKQLTVSVAQTRYNQVKMLSSGLCNKSAEQDITMACTSDVLQVAWPTDCLFDTSSMNKQKERVLAVIHENLKRVKDTILDLVFPSLNPPIIQPSLNKEGFPASVVLTPVCSDRLKYVDTTDSCQ